jgi:hypothetical protein
MPHDGLRIEAFGGAEHGSSYREPRLDDVVALDRQMKHVSRAVGRLRWFRWW